MRRHAAAGDFCHAAAAGENKTARRRAAADEKAARRADAPMYPSTVVERKATVSG